MATDRFGAPVEPGELVVFSEIATTALVVAVADSGIYVDLNGVVRFVRSSDRCFTATGPAAPSGQPPTSPT